MRSNESVTFALYSELDAADLLLALLIWLARLPRRAERVIAADAASPLLDTLPPKQHTAERKLAAELAWRWKMDFEAFAPAVGLVVYTSALRQEAWKRKQIATS